MKIIAIYYPLLNILLNGIFMLRQFTSSEFEDSLLDLLKLKERFGR